MTLKRLAPAALASLLTLAACSERGEAPAPENGVTNELLAHVPTDSPYVLANLEPVPDDVIDVYLTRLQPALNAMQAELSTARMELESAAEAVGTDDDSPTGTPSRDDGARLALALLRELDGKLSREGLESLGLDLRSHKVIHGMGAFPVIRLGLTDPATLRATVERVMANADISAPQVEFKDVPYWRVSDDDPANSPVGLYIAILDTQLAVSVFPPTAEDELLPYFLGLEMPADSNARDNLVELNREHDYRPYGSGILDLHLLADRFLQPDTIEARVLAASGDFDPAALPPQCATEIHGIIDNMPRMTMGTTELSASAIAVQYRLETPRTLAGQLMALVSKIPAVDAVSDRALEFAFGMKFGPVRDFLLEKADAIAAEPYTCEHLADLNSSATDLQTQLSQPMPPFLNNFRGIRASLSEIVMRHDSIPENASGHLAVHVEQPEMFIGMAQMFLPDLSELAISAGEPPVQLPQSLLPTPEMVAYAAMSDEAIGLSVGEGEEDSLVAYLGREPGPPGVFLSAGYDMAAYLAHSRDVGQRYLASASDLQDHSQDPHMQSARNVHEAAMEAFAEMADRSHTTLRFTEEGFVADNRMTFK